MIRTLTMIVLFLATTSNQTLTSNTSTGEALEQCLNEHFDCTPHPFGRMKSIFPMYDCGCEKKFFVCLRNIQSNAADHVGALYFALNSQCITLMHADLFCLESQKIRIASSIPISRCIRYLVVNEKTTPVEIVVDTNFYMNSSMQYYSPEYTTTFQSSNFGPAHI